MSWIATAVVGGSLIGGVVASKSASKAADATKDATQAGIDQQNKQFDAVQKLLLPYTSAGPGALTGQQDLLGLNGQQAQRTAINGIQNSAQFDALARQGETGILANASATGGLRGGNTQGALATFRPQLLSALIDQQYSRLGGLTSLGENAAAGVGNAGIQSGNNVTSLLGQMGAANAGNALAQGNAINGVVNGVVNGFGVYQGLNRPTASASSAYTQNNGGFGTGYAWGQQDLGAYF